ncbi:hypothetical protein HT118_21655 [Escherichia coli]|nr:hypothetical protein [Escherichia coli]
MGGYYAYHAVEGLLQKRVTPITDEQINGMRVKDIGKVRIELIHLAKNNSRFCRSSIRLTREAQAESDALASPSGGSDCCFAE